MSQQKDRITMEKRYQRTALITGGDGIEKLKSAAVAVFGLGGVGGYAAEALARSGIGTMALVDNDIIDETNLNRQILALQSTLGRRKTELMKERILDINPDACVDTYDMFFLPENSDDFDFDGYDYIVDAVDTVAAKTERAVKAREAGIPLISAMGTGNKMEAGMFETADIYESAVCPLARVMRKELRKRGIEHLKIVYSREVPLRNDPPGSMPFVPPAAGMIMAGEVVKDILKEGG